MNKNSLRLSFPVLLCSLFIALCIAGSSCRKEKLLKSGGEVRFSTDTLTFDTVFTALGSATIGVKIFNPQSEKISLSSVRLAGSSTSPFRLNVDGKAGDGSNVDIAANDSIYVFATVKVDPTDENSPFIIEDKLVATLNGADFSIPIIAYGQNAYYIRDSVLNDHIPNHPIVWKTDKPYVIFNSALVDSSETLTIPAGCRIYMHANSRLFVAGTLNAVGTKKDSIIFQGDRLDRSYFGYEGYPGEWGGLYFTEISKGNVLQHVIIANCGNTAFGTYPAAIQLNPGSELTMSKTVIQNSFGYGVLSFGGTLNADNCLIHSCGATALALLQGGAYQLDNCTFATYPNNKINHTDDNPVAVIVNFFYKIPNGPPTLGALKATLTNCVIAGPLENEFIGDSIEFSTSPAAIALNHCLIKAKPARIRPWIVDSNVKYTLADNTLDPQFIDIPKGNYRPKSNSPLIDAGTTASSSFDLDENNRTQGTAPDIGCYEVK